MEPLELAEPIHTALVSVGNTTPVSVEVSVNTEDHTVKCPCKFFEEFGVPCDHGKAPLLRIGETGSDWYECRYHTATYKESYSASIPGYALAGKLAVDETFIPPEHRRPAGRPAKKRKDRSHMRKTQVRRECKACGQLGHFDSTCANPSTEYRYKTHKMKAIEWCKKQQKECSL